MKTTYRGRDLRKGRYSEQGRFYLITSVTYRRCPLFADFELACMLVNAMRHHDATGNTETLAFVVMPDHFHWMLCLVGDLGLPRLMDSLKGWTSRRIKACHDLGDDPVWQPGFYDHALRRDEDVASVARYVVANPLRAGLVGRLGDYPFWDAAWL